MTDDDLTGLRERALAGEPGAMEDLLRELQPLVLRRCAGFLPHRADAEEAAQDALMTVASKLDSFQGRGSFVGWVVVVASNSARATYRSLKRRSGEVAADSLLERRAEPRTTSVIAGTRLDLLEALEAMEADHPEWVEPVVLRDVSGLTYDDIALQTDQPLGTVKAAIHRGRKYLRERLTERLG